MRRVQESRRFLRDKKRIERSSRYSSAMEKRFKPALAALVNDEQLDPSYYDHLMTIHLKEIDKERGNVIYCLIFCLCIGMKAMMYCILTG